MANTYDIGDQVTLKVTFTDLAGAVVDPTTVTCMVKVPNSPFTETSYVYPVTNMTRVSTGIYTFLVTLNQSGDWKYRWKGTGALIAAEEGRLTVRTSFFTTP